MRTLFFLVLFTPLVAHSQNDSSITHVIDLFFTGLGQKDTLMIRETLIENASLESVGPKGEVQVSTFSGFLKNLASLPELELEERLINMEVRNDGSLAMVWAPYEFYINGEMSHCGSNLFTLIHTPEGWKIRHIIDSRKKDCTQRPPGH